jgi:hypothetical protein
MSPTLEQTAQQIAEQRRQEAIKLFESAYAELLAPLRGSRMEYKAAIRKNDDVEIVFSKLGIPDVALVMLPQGFVSSTDKQPLTPQALISFLADHIAKQEALVRQAERTAAWVRKYNTVFYAWLGLFIGTALVFIVRFVGLTASHYEGANVTMCIGLAALAEVIGLGIYVKCLPDLPGSEV